MNSSNLSNHQLSIPASKVAVQSEPSLSQRSLQGFVWLFSQTMAARLIAFGSQIVLAWLLLPSDFGLIAVAYSIQAFATIVQKNGVEKILVARQDQFHKLVNPAFWYSLSAGVIAAAIMGISAPFAAAMLNKADLTGLIFVMALAAPFNALAVVPTAMLSIDLRFGTKALVNTISYACQMLLTVIFAVLDFGAYCFVLPMLIVAPITSLTLHLLTRPPIKLNPEFRQWPTLLGLSGLILTSTLLNLSIEQGDYLILGIFYSSEVVGIYFFAYSLSIQTFTLFTNNLVNVLFPTLSRLQNEPIRQRAAFIRVAQLLTLVAIPASLFVAVTADPLVRLLFSDKWLDAIPILQVLAIGLSLRPLGAISSSYLQAQGKFAVLLIVNVIRCSLFFILTLSVVQLGVIYFAVAATVPFIVGPVINTFFALGFSLKTFSDLLSVIFLPTIAAILATIFVLLLNNITFESWTGLVISLTTSGLLFASITLILTWMFRPYVWADLMDIKKKVINRSK